MKEDLEDPSRGPQIRARILAKPGLHAWYEDIYKRWSDALGATPEGGPVVEIGSGAAFARERVPGLLATDTLPYEGIDLVVNGETLPWGDSQVRALFMLNVFHHLPDPAAFLREAQRVLKPGGLLFITDEHPGAISGPILRWAHSEPFDPRARDWENPVSGPLAGANGAAAWIVFQRDQARFKAEFPALQLEHYSPFAPLLYWLSGGLKDWTLVPGPLLGLVQGLDRALLALWPGFGSFCHIQLRKLP